MLLPLDQALLLSLNFDLMTLYISIRVKKSGMVPHLCLVAAMTSPGKCAAQTPLCQPGPAYSRQDTPYSLSVQLV